MNKKLQILLTVLLIVLISLISFVGLYSKDNIQIINLIKNYRYDMELSGSRELSIIVDTELVNEDEKILENFKASKKIMENRLDDLGLSHYYIAQNEKTGEMVVEIPEDEKTSIAVQYIYSNGIFEVVDSETEEVLLDNSNLEGSEVFYAQPDENAYVYLSIKFNEESKEALEQITKDYIYVVDEEGEEISKNVSINLDGNPLLVTSFQEENATGELVLTVGSATTNDELNLLLQEARDISVLIDNGNLPISYTADRYDLFIQTSVTSDTYIMIATIFAALILVISIIIGIKNIKNAAIILVSAVGYIALLLLTIRYTNVVLTIGGVLAIGVMTIVNMLYTLANIYTMDKNKESYLKSLLKTSKILMPLLIISIVFSLRMWLPFIGIGEVIFWGILLIIIYNSIITRNLVK